jgi:amino acid transporter
MLTSTSSTLKTTRLRAIGVMLSVISAIAPFVVGGLIVPTSIAVTGLTGIPLAFLAVGAVLGVFSVGYVTMAKYVANAGAFYTFIAHGLGKPAGVAAAAVALLAYNGFQIGAAGGVGALAAPLFQQWFAVDLPWWSYGLTAWAVVATLGLRSLDVSKRVIAVLITAEITAITLFSLAGLTDAHGAVTAAPFPPSVLFTGGGALVVLAVMGFAGWEQTVAYSEEVTDATPTIRKATYLSLAFIAVLYAFASWAMITAGGTQIVSRAQAEGPDLIFNLAGESLGQTAATIGRALILTSLLAAMISFHNIIARYGFALGREGVIAVAFGRTGRRTGAPIYGSLAQSALALAVLLLFTWFGGDPLVQLFYYGGSIGAFGVLLLITATAIAVPVYFARSRPTENAWRTRYAPVTAAVLLLALTGLAVSNVDVLLGVAPGSALTWVVPLAFAVAALTGAVWALVLKVTRPQVYTAIGLGADAATTPAIPAPRTPTHSAATRQEARTR